MKKQGKRLHTHGTERIKRQCQEIFDLTISQETREETAHSWDRKDKRGSVRRFSVWFFNKQQDNLDFFFFYLKFKKIQSPWMEI